MRTRSILLTAILSVLFVVGIAYAAENMRGVYNVTGTMNIPGTLSTTGTVTSTATLKAPALDAASAGALTLGGTVATSLSLCNSAACDTVTIGTNTDADTITIGDSTDTTVSITDDNWSIGAGGIASFAHLRTVNNASLTASDVNLTKAQIQAAGAFPVSTTANAVDVDFGDNAALDAADVGSEKVFIITAGGTNALTVTAGASGVTTMVTINASGTTCEDVGDLIRCTVVSTSSATCLTVCAD